MRGWHLVLSMPIYRIGDTKYNVYCNELNWYIEKMFKQIIIVKKSDNNLSLLALPCPRILLVQGGVYCLPCGGWVAHGFLPTYLPT